MKKLFCIVIAIAMVFGLVACTSNGETATNAVSESASAPESASAEVSETASASAEASEYTGEEMTLSFSVAEAEGSITGQGDLRFKELVEDATNDKVKIELYFNSTLFPQDQEVEAMLKGNLDLNNGWFGWQTSYMPELAMFDMAYLFKDLEHARSYFNSDAAQELFDRIADEVGIRYLVADSIGYRTMNLDIDRKVTSREDLSDIKLRVPNTNSFMFAGEALGANSTPINFSDLYLSLQTGAVDGQDNPVATIISASFYEVTESVTITGHMTQNYGVNMREDLWQSMSPELQQIIQDAAKQAGVYTEELSESQLEEGIAFLEEHGLKVYTLTDEELTAYSQEVRDYYFNTDAGKEITDDWDMDLYQQIQDSDQ